MIQQNISSFSLSQDEIYNELTVVPRKKTTSSSTTQQPPAPPGKSKAAKMRAVARGENTAGSAKSEQEVLCARASFCFHPVMIESTTGSSYILSS